MRAALPFLIVVLFCSVSRGEGYFERRPVVSALNQAPTECTPCAKFYRAQERSHRFIGAQLSITCPGESEPKIYHEAYGFPEYDDGDELAAILQGKRFRQQKVMKRGEEKTVNVQVREGKAEFVRELCGPAARAAIEKSAKISNDTAERFLRNELLIMGRVIFGTPLWGTPCRLASEEVEKALGEIKDDIGQVNENLLQAIK